VYGKAGYKNKESCPSRFRQLKITIGGSGRPPISAAVQTLDEAESWCDQSAKKILEGSRLSIKDIDVFNPYDVFTQFCPALARGFRLARREEGRGAQVLQRQHRRAWASSVLSSGGNNGTGRTRTAFIRTRSSSYAGRLGSGR
jgi:hypothetical protein